MIRKFQTFVPILIILLAGLALLYPLYQKGFILTDDGSWMVIRLSAFYQSFREGQFPVRFLGRLNHSYGYPVANFLYPGFLYLGSVIHIIGFTFVNSVKIILGASLITSGIFVYLWLTKFFRKIPSLMGALSFISGPYLLFDLYSRGSVGELLALSVAALGFYSIEAQLPWLFSLSVGLIILAHNSLALLFIVLFTVYLLVRKLILRFWIWMVIGIGMSSFFWMPAIYEQKYIVFSRAIVSNPMEYFIRYKNIWLIGFAGLLAAVSTFFVKPKIRMYGFFLTIFAVSLLFSSSLSEIIWRNRWVGSLFQFPFRLLSVAIFAAAWFTAYSLQSYRKFWIPIALIFAAIWVIHLRIVFSGVRYEYQPESYYSTNEATTTVKDEYMPKWVSTVPLYRTANRFEFLKGSGLIDAKAVTTQYFDLVVHANEQSVLQFNTLYYPGWGITVDNQLAPIDYKNDAGLMRVSVPAGDHRVIANFRETISRFIADICSVTAIILFVIFLLSDRITARKLRLSKKQL